MSKLLISACLLGHKVRYDGNHNLQTHVGLQALIAAGQVISICPEMIGGLPTPRAAAEIQQGSGADVLAGRAAIIDANGNDVSAQYCKGAHHALQLVKQHNIRIAILKARSPSCGSTAIYDGTFSRTVIEGQGVTAALLSQHGVQIFDESQINAAIAAFSSSVMS